MKRLLSVIHGPDFGGAHNQLLRLRDPLRERGFDTIAVLSSEAVGPASRFRSAGIETHQIPLSRLRATPDPLVQARFARGLRRDVARLRDLLTGAGADLVQAHGPINPQAPLAARAAEPRPAVVWQILDSRTPVPVRTLTMPMVRRLADSITCWGHELARIHPGARRLGERLVLVYPPVDASVLKPGEATRRRSRERLGVSGDEVVVGTLAVRNPQKGIEWLVRAAALIAARDERVVFRILGSPSTAHARYEADLHGLAREAGLLDSRLQFVDLGETGHDLLQALDVFVLSSVPRSEGIPTAILEAMALAKPVVATDVGGVREIVDDGTSGFLVPPEDAEGLARAVLRLTSDEDQRRRFGSAGRDLATREFDLNRLADLHARAYELAIGHRLARTASSDGARRRPDRFRR